MWHYGNGKFNEHRQMWWLIHHVNASGKCEVNVGEKGTICKFLAGPAKQSQSWHLESSLAVKHLKLGKKYHMWEAIFWTKICYYSDENIFEALIHTVHLMAWGVDWVQVSASFPGLPFYWSSLTSPILSLFESRQRRLSCVCFTCCPDFTC